MARVLVGVLVGALVAGALVAGALDKNWCCIRPGSPNGIQSPKECTARF